MIQMPMNSENWSMQVIFFNEVYVPRDPGKTNFLVGYPGILLGYPGAHEKFEKVCVQFLCPNNSEINAHLWFVQCDTGC